MLCSVPSLLCFSSVLDAQLGCVRSHLQAELSDSAMGSEADGSEMGDGFEESDMVDESDMVSGERSILSPSSHMLALRCNATRQTAIACGTVWRRR